MKRDPELMREILLALEAKPDTSSLLHPRELKGWDEEAVVYELKLLKDAGYIDARLVERSEGGIFCLGRLLTVTGHELLDKIRTDTQWSRTRELLRKQGLAVCVETVKAAATVVLEQMLRGRSS